MYDTAGLCGAAVAGVVVAFSVARDGGPTGGWGGALLLCAAVSLGCAISMLGTPLPLRVLALLVAVISGVAAAATVGRTPVVVAAGLAIAASSAAGRPRADARWTSTAGGTSPSATLAVAVAAAIWALSSSLAATSAMAAVSLACSWSSADPRSVVRRIDDRVGTRLRSAATALARSRVRGRARGLLVGWKSSASAAPVWMVSGAGGVVFAVLMSPLVYRFVTDPTAQAVAAFNDYPGHLWVARHQEFRLDRIVPFLFHVCTWLGAKVIGERWSATAVLLLALAAGTAGLVRIGLLPDGRGRSLGPRWALGVALVTMVAESPSVLLIMLRGISLERVDRDAFTALHLWPSPTDTLSLGLSLVLLSILVSVAEGHLDLQSRRLRWCLAVVGAAATFARPGFPVLVVGAIPVLVGLGNLGRSSLRTLGLWYVLPVSAALALQAAMFALFVPPEVRGSVAFDPLATVRGLHLGDRGASSFALLAFVPLMIWAVRRDLFRDVTVRVGIITLVLAATAMLFFAEQGPRVQDANVAKLATVPLVVLFAGSTRLLALAIRDRRRESAAGAARSSMRTQVAAAFFAVCLISGVFSYLDATGVRPIPQPAIGFPIADENGNPYGITIYDDDGKPIGSPVLDEDGSPG